MSEYIINDEQIAENRRLHGKKLLVMPVIVRCRDCKEYRDTDATCHSWQWHNWDAPIEVEPDGFCAWGERKEA